MGQGRGVLPSGMTFSTKLKSGVGQEAYRQLCRPTSCFRSRCPGLLFAKVVETLKTQCHISHTETILGQSAAILTEVQCVAVTRTTSHLS